jgi:hypothetical protein
MTFQCQSTGIGANVLAGFRIVIDSQNGPEVQRWLAGGNDVGIGAVQFQSTPLIAGTYTIKGQFRVAGGALDLEVGPVQLSAQGLQAAIGPVGPVGPTGATGDVGPTGDQGVTGDVGPTGDQGVTGDVGPTGDQGVTGDVGPTGDQGVTGDVGATGDQGVTGAASLSIEQTGSEATGTTTSVPVGPTTPTGWTEKLSMTTSSLPTGLYRVGYTYSWWTDVKEKEMEVRVQLDDAALLALQSMSNPGGVGTLGVLSGGFAYANLGGVHTIDIDFGAPGGDTVNIRQARIELWKAD